MMIRDLLRLTLLMFLAGLTACAGSSSQVTETPATATAEDGTGGQNPTMTPTVESQESASPTPTVDLAAAEAAREAVEGFDPEEPEAFARLNQIVVEDPDIVPELAPYLEDDDPERRFAALYVAALLADSEAEAELLKPALEDPLPGYRVMAAGSLIGLGAIEAIPVLIDELENDEPLPYDKFNRPIWDLAQEALAAYIGWDEMNLATQEQWQGWWDGYPGENLIWDGEKYVVEHCDCILPD